MGTISSRYRISEEFWQVCRDGCIDKYYSLYNNPHLDIHHKRDRAFRMACQYGNTELVIQLLNTTFFCVNVHAVNEYAFRWACRNGHTDVVKHLLQLTNDREIDINIFDDEAFRLACEFGRIDIVKLLLDIKDHRKVNVNAKGGQPLRLACSNGYIQIVELLLENNVDIAFDENDICDLMNKKYFEIVYRIISVGKNTISVDDIILKQAESAF